MIRHKLEVFADYHQFYLWDRATNPLAPTDYTDQDVQNMVKVAPGVVVIQPVRNMTVPVNLEVHETEPECDATEWDHVVECSLDLPTGKLQVHECTGGPVLDLDLDPGSYRVRALFAGLSTLSPDGLDGEDEYTVALWKGLPTSLRVVKQWSGAPASQ